jgi:hypothetical protein
VFSSSSEILFLFVDLFSFIVDDVSVLDEVFLEIVSVFCSGEESSRFTIFIFLATV